MTLAVGAEFDYRVSAGLPALAWLARINRAAGGLRVEVSCGASVRRSEEGFFEGAWSGATDLRAVAGATAVFGSGIVSDDDGGLLIVPPAHSQAGVFTVTADDGLLVANSFAGLLSAAGLELRADIDYPGRFIRVLEGVVASPIELPTTGAPVEQHFFENLRVDGAGRLSVERKPREAPFSSFADYRRRLSSALASVLACAAGYEPVVALSSGYDSTAVAVVAAERGCRRALTFATSRPKAGRQGDPDSGERTAHRLGLVVETADRLAYHARDDLPEAEFLATGMTGEDVIMSAFEPQLRRALLLSGAQGNGMWRHGGGSRAELRRSGLDGSSLNEFRLRVDFVYVPLPVFGITARDSLVAISAAPDMRPYSVGGHYDQPVPRRIAEEAGLPRGTFAVRKRAASALIHAEGRAALAPATAAALDAFAAAEGRAAEFPRRRQIGRRHRLALAAAEPLRAQRFVAALAAARRRLVHFEPEIGTLLLRWALSVVRPRYGELSE